LRNTFGVLEGEVYPDNSSVSREVSLARSCELNLPLDSRGSCMVFIDRSLSLAASNSKPSK
jgi:hypothetical protein